MRKHWNSFAAQVGRMDKRAKRLLVISLALSAALLLAAGAGLWLSSVTGRAACLLFSEDAAAAVPYVLMCGVVSSFVWDIVFRHDHI